MGNCNACCGNDKGDQIDIKSPNEDMKNTLALAKKNVRLIVKIQAWARGNQVRRKIANKMNTANRNAYSYGMQPQGNPSFGRHGGPNCQNSMPQMGDGFNNMQQQNNNFN